MAPDGRVGTLVEWALDGALRPIRPDSPEGLGVLAAGRDILYVLDDEWRLRDLAYPGVLEAMRREIQLTMHRVMHGELLDEPEVAPILRRLLAEIEATGAAFRRALDGLQAKE